MRSWAIEHGATHYTHWFQPLTGSTAEKHDAFLSLNGRGGALDGHRRGMQDGVANRFGGSAYHVRAFADRRGL